MDLMNKNIFQIFSQSVPSYMAAMLTMVSQCDFQNVKKALSYDIMPTITFFAHAGFSTVGFENFPIIVGGILAAPIALKDKAFGGISRPD